MATDAQMQDIERCRGKVDFESREAAVKSDARRRRLHGGFKHHPYECRWCGQWHLTSTAPGRAPGREG